MDWGLTLAGFDHAWFCEADPYCQSILAQRWPGVPVYGDVRELRSPAPVDVLTGGFPCQPFSLAGERQGLADDRWLWPEFARLVGELRPRYVIVENVPGLLAGHGGMGGVLGDLAALGYDAEWDCLPARAVGAPHIRYRVFLVAYPGSTGRRENTGGASGDESQDAGWAAVEDHVVDGDGEGGGARDVADTDGFGRVGRPRFLGPAGRPEPTHSGWWATEPDLGRMAHGVPRRVDRLKALGNGVVPQVARWIGERILEAEQLTAAA